MKHSVLSSSIMNLTRKGVNVLWYYMIPIRRYCTILYNNTVSVTSIHTGRCKHMVDMKERSIETNRFLRRISMEEKNWCVPFERRTDWYKGTFHTSRSTVTVKERPIGTNEISKDNMYKIEREINWDQRFDSVKNRRIGIKGTYELYRPDLIVRKIGRNKCQQLIFNKFECQFK